MSDTPERSADPSQQPPASPPPLTVQEWLAAAPKLDPFSMAATDAPGEPVVPPPATQSEPPGDALGQPETLGQPVDVVPIVGMTPITEQERAQVVEGGAEDFVPSDQVEASEAEKTVELAPAEPAPLEIASASESLGVGTDAAHPAVLPAEPSPRELAEMPPEPQRPVPVPVLPMDGAEPQAAAEPTSTEVFVHAHDDVESRGGQFGSAYVTQVAGVIGLLGCTAGLAVMLTACFGYSRIYSFPVLSVGYWVMWAGVGGLVIGILGGIIEHRRMREETHVLGALFSNALAAIGGLLLWMAATGVDIFAVGTKAAGG